ncbi:hypothetical protein O181_010139 [Austropuccinia psidii MF-1]|uniref:Uncharacterized protein n=1 Tax=Austropuccinia psidii MF-1 TaxID=1389203 RepID=A0A9Q3GKJ4_9BASI|nr:hypothetical protein [Austropuccinia psidii MF-1]
MLPLCPPDVTPTLPPHLCPHHSLCLDTPASSSLPLTILALLPSPQDMPLMLPSHRHDPQRCLPSLCSCSSLKMRLQCHPPSLLSPLLMLTHPSLIFSTA